MTHILQISSELAAFATDLGKRRHMNAQAHGRRTSSNVDGKDSIHAHMLGARCEAAAYNYYGRSFEWDWDYDHAEIDRKPDLGGFIDVKGVCKRFHNLLVPVRVYEPHMVYLLVEEMPDRWYHIVGWSLGKDIPEKVIYPQPGRPCYKQLRCKLKDPTLLWETYDELSRLPRDTVCPA